MKTILLIIGGVIIYFWAMKTYENKKNMPNKRLLQLDNDFTSANKTPKEILSELQNISGLSYKDEKYRQRLIEIMKTK